jgi:hypothetical protein
MDIRPAHINADDYVRRLTLSKWHTCAYLCHWVLWLGALDSYAIDSVP